MRIRQFAHGYSIAGVVFLMVVLGTAATFIVRALFASQPAGGTVSQGTALSWTGGPFLASNPVDCGQVEAACDRYLLTVVPPPGNFVLTVRVDPRNVADDVDLFIRDASGETVASSSNSTGVEEVVLVNPAAGTYTVVVQPFLVSPLSGGVYDGVAGIGAPAGNEKAKSYHGAIFSPGFTGVPAARPAKSAPGVRDLAVSFNYVGRQAAEPTIGVNRSNTAFYAAGAFDSLVGVPGVARLARTEVLRSRDKGATWQMVSPLLPLAEGATTTESPFSLDPMLYVDPVTGRVFSVDLYAGCAWAIFSDDEGTSWQRNPLSCGQPVNDHHTIVTAPPPSGLSTVGYPNMLYYCFNRVADSACGRSNDGGQTFTPAGQPFTGVDNVAGQVCGGLTGHLAADASGRIFLPKGHCNLPWVATSLDGGVHWTRSNVANHTPMADHEVSLAVDTAENIYAVWQDRTYRLPVLSVSRDHGRTWSTPIVFAPPGVREVNFPTITAGDPGRIAALFPGTESADQSDATRPWNIYVVISVNALENDPLFTWTTANDPRDPVHRGSCGPGRCDAEDDGSMFDFLDIQVSPGDGAFWGTASDTCVGDCVTNPQAPKLRPGQGVAIRQTKGPALFRRR